MLLSLERPTVPEWIEREVGKMGGKSPAGGPMYRIVWGASKVTTPQDVTDHYEPNRWHLEKWVEGHYQHAYKFGYCPHMKEGEKRWCKSCMISGGEVFPLETHFPIIEKVLVMFVRTEQLQRSSADRGAKMERDALFEREKQKEEEAGKVFREALLGNLSAIDRVPHSLSPRGAKTSMREVDMPLHAGQIRSKRGKRMPKPNDFKQV